MRNFISTMTNPRCPVRVFGLVALCLFWLHPAQVLSAPEKTSESKSFLWQVDSPTTRAYLMGSIHLLRQDVYPLAPAVEEAFAASDILVLEADPFSMPQEEMLQTVMTYATYPEGQTLKNQLSQEDYLELSGVLLEAGISGKSVQQYQPWYISTMVQQFLFGRLGIRPEYGVDYYFRSKAEQKEIKELESVEEQIQMLAGFSDHEQILMMMWTIEDIEHVVEDFDEMVKAWQSGDIQTMEQELQKEIQEEPRFKPIWDRMVISRNFTMADEIATYMTTSKRHFIVVGVGHLVGQQSLVALLHQRGYAVKQL